MFHDHQHPDVSPSHWEGFRRELSPYVIETVLDRREVNVRLGSYPWRAEQQSQARIFCTYRAIAPVLIANAAKQKVHCDVLSKDVRWDNLVVRGYRGQPLSWFERNGSPGRPHDRPNRTLVRTFGSTPIVTREYRAATYLAEFCFFNDPPARASLGEQCPDDLSGAIRIVKKSAHTRNSCSC